MDMGSTTAYSALRSKDATMTSSIWKKEYVSDTYSESAAIGSFVERSNGEAITISHSITMRGSMLGLAEGCADILAGLGISSILKTDEARFVAIEADSIIIGVSRNSRSGYDEYAVDIEGPALNTKQDISSFSLLLASNRDTINKFLTIFRDRYKDHKYAQIKWWHEGSNGQISNTVTYIEKPATTLRSEFYPDMKDPQDYIKRYLESDASVLLMAGPPGTGKTTMLRHIIHDNSLAASVVYDERLMEKDAIFQNFLFGKDEDILIIEDADLILTSREADKNKLMSRFLNVSDGLIKLPNKKIVFTTNISDFGRVDQALMRPGRCFDVLHTRALNLDEAVAATKAAGLTLPFERREYTIAELFNQGKRQDGRVVGFTQRGG